MNGLKVTVLMPVYNGAKFLREALESVLGQTFKGFELIVLDGGSSDQSIEIVRSISDPRVRLYVDDCKLNLAKTLNRGVDLARGEYIARMDSDDVCRADRLEKQVRFMDLNQQVGICGSWINIIGEGPLGLQRLPIGHDEIACQLLFANILAHPTIMFRKRFLDENRIRYSPEFKAAEDYELWSRCIQLTRFAVIPEALLFYRTHKNNASRLKFSEQQEAIEKIAKSQFARYFQGVSDQDIKTHLALSNGSFKLDRENVIKIESWLRKLIDLNQVSGPLSKTVLPEIAQERWVKACRLAKSLGLWVLFKCWSSALWREGKAGFRHRNLMLARIFGQKMRSTISNLFRQEGK